MPYEPPAGDAADFILALYTPPDGDEADFELADSPDKIELEIEFASPVGFSFVGTIDLELDCAELPAPPALEFAHTGTIDLELEVEGVLRTFTSVTPGESLVTVYNQNGLLMGTLTPLKYRISRYSNQIGDWECELPLDEELDDDDVPLASRIQYGWRISITQENFEPDHGAGSGHLLYQGIVEDRQFPVSEGGSAKLMLKGSFRTYAAVRRSVLTNYEYNTSLSALTSLLIGNLLDPYGPIIDGGAGSVTVKGTYNDLSKYAAWVKAASLGRRVIRETWDHDRPELVRYDGAPDSGITFRPYVSPEDRYAHANGGSGVALIAGRPVLSWLGANVVNRIIPRGVDTVEEGTVDLTLQYATLASPYTVKAGVNPDATLYYYIEDEDSIEQYGLTELALNFSDVKNPNDLLASRQRAANVLYMRAVNELIKRRSEKIEITLPPLANGAHIWALPGDSALVTYRGEIEVEGGASVWMDIDERRMLITERHEQSDPSGIRRVGYKLAAPEMEFPVPGLPGEIVLPPDSPPGDDPGEPDAPGSEPCCEDPNDNQNEGPDDEFEETFPEPEAQYIIVGNRDLFVISTNAGVPWDHVIASSGGVTVPQPPPETFAIDVPDLGAGTWSVNASIHYHVIGDGSFAIKINDGEIASFSQTLSNSDNSITGGGGEVIIPIVAGSFDDGEFGSVHVSIVRTAGTGLIDFLYGDSYLKLTFTPDP